MSDLQPKDCPHYRSHSGGFVSCQLVTTYVGWRHEMMEGDCRTCLKGRSDYPEQIAPHENAPVNRWACNALLDRVRLRLDDDDPQNPWRSIGCTRGAALAKAKLLTGVCPGDEVLAKHLAAAIGKGANEDSVFKVAVEHGVVEDDQQK